MSLPTLNVIICSTRPGRIGPTIAKWFHGIAASSGKFDAMLVDLEDFKLPVYNEPEHPRLRKYQHDHTKSWSRSVELADAFVFVTPEYNGGPPPPLLNALNYVYAEWNYKPASFVSYGGVSAGLKAVQIERIILNTLKVVPIVEQVMIPMVRERIDASGTFNATEMLSASATSTIDELARWSGALSVLRRKE